MIQSKKETGMTGSHRALENSLSAAETKGGSHSHHRQSFMPSRYVWIHPTHIWRPPTDVVETEQLIRVQTEVAGMEHSEFSVQLDGKVLRISGVRSGAAERCVYHPLEIHNGEFLTEVDLPADVQIEEIRSQYQDGFLTVQMRKKQ
jgi:HSP20 family molecular chaperone IbpA